MTNPRYEGPESTPEQGEPGDAPARSSAPDFEREESRPTQLGEDPGTLEPDDG
jgi:hypothetical protein